MTWSEAEDHADFDAGKDGADCEGKDDGFPEGELVVVEETLAPGDEGEGGEDDGLGLDRDVEVLDDGVDGHGDAGRGPDEHHGAQAFGGFGAEVFPDLGEELHTPENGSDGSEDIGEGGNVFFGHFGC